MLSLAVAGLICSSSAKRFNPSVAGNLKTHPADTRVGSVVAQDDAPVRVRGDDFAVADDAIDFSWGSIPDGTVWDKLGQLKGGAVYKMDLNTRVMSFEGNDNFDKFLGLAEGDLKDTLSGAGEYTLLAPTNSAIDSATRMDDPIDPKLHVLKGKYSLEDLKKGGEMETLAGKTITIGKPLKIVKANNAALKGNFNPADHKSGTDSSAFPYDVDCTNGYIHAVDEVIEA
jgi:uncharacterized surface protein with fasciclin (FAS1) repeats